MNNYKDIETDLINYERTNTDNIGLKWRKDFEECEKIINNQSWYLKGEYIKFWQRFLFGNILMIGLALFLSIIAFFGTIELISANDDDDEDKYY